MTVRTEAEVRERACELVALFEPFEGSETLTEVFVKANGLVRRSLVETAEDIAVEWSVVHFIPVEAADVCEGLDEDWFMTLGGVVYSFSNDVLRSPVFGAIHEGIGERFWAGEFRDDDGVYSAVNDALRNMGF